MFRVRVPGSSANLGPGFDTLALALDVYLEVEARPRGDGALVHLSGKETDGLPTDERNLVWRAFAQTMPSGTAEWELHVRNEIPLGRGLGSSGAAAVAGVALAGAVSSLGLTRHEVLGRAAAIEGHPDNVAASVLGGLAVVALAATGDAAPPAAAVSLKWPRQIGLLLAIPDCRLATAQARAALPGSYTRADAVFNLQRTALLLSAVATRDPSALAAALEDRFHQPYRSSLVPGLSEALALRLPGLLGVALSGAGPSLIAFVTDPKPARAALENIYGRLGIRCQVRKMRVAKEGVRCG